MTSLKKMTDRQLVKVYFSLANHYKECLSRSPEISVEELYTELFYGVYASLHEDNGQLVGLSDAEQQKVYRVLNTFFDASPKGRQNGSHATTQLYESMFQRTPPALTQASTSDRYDFLDHYSTWQLLSTLRPQINYYQYPDATGSRAEHGHFNYAMNQRGGESSVSAMLLVLAISVASIACNVWAAYYLLNETLQASERLVYGEGRMQASLTLLSMASSFIAATTLASVFATSPLMSLAFSAGLASPIGFVVFCVLSLGLIGSALGCLLTNQIQNHVIKQANLDALDPSDPYRYKLTDMECTHLENRGIDPIKVKCAMVVLRAEMGDKGVVAPLNRWFSAQSIQPYLAKIRELRRGEITEVRAGGMIFDCTDYRRERVPAPTV